MSLREASQSHVDDVVILPSNSLKKVLANDICPFGTIVGRCIYLVHPTVIPVVSHQNSVHVTPAIKAVVVLLDFVRQLICMGCVEVSNGVVAVLVFVSDDWEQVLRVVKLVETVLPQRGVAQGHHVVVQAVLDVPHQQLQTVARRWLAEAAVLQLLLRVESFQSCGDSE